ncbi:DUF3168 domain-containing protein [Paraburkholderia sp. Tr-20389]|nr:DUF3168 domain-containing protein [Paraburkholderia sp. Tr-20389]
MYAALQQTGCVHIFPDVAPEGTTPPWLAYQMVGGQTTAYVSNRPGLKNARIQISVWAVSRFEAGTLMHRAIAVLCDPPTGITLIGAPISTYEHKTALYGATADFSVWYSSG